MSNDLNRIFDWFCSNKLKLNILKTDFIVLSSLQRIATLDENISFNVTTSRNYKVSWPNYRPVSYLEKSFYLPAFLDTGLPRRKAHERDSGPKVLDKRWDVVF